MFCMETAVKLLAFSLVVYEGAEVKESETGADIMSEGCVNTDHHTVLQVEESVSQVKYLHHAVH